MLEWWKTRNEVRTADYTLRLKRRFRECVHVIDQEAGRDFHFSGELVGKSWSQINISLPKALPDQDISALDSPVRSRSLATNTSSSECLAPRTEEVPASEQEAALGKMREMGYEPEVGTEGARLEITKTPDWNRPGPQQAKEQALQMMRLIKARGKRTCVEILAKSDSAVDDFV
jgi:hypothetical protein